MDQLISFIIRPPRADYNPAHDLLDQEFVLKGKWFRRKDLEIKNNGGNVLQCSHYIPILSPDVKALPCVIYCHGNSGCRADASEAAIVLLPSNITVFTLDFSGSGLSGGEHVTLGWNEKDDLRTVVEYLRADQSVSTIGLWGRSMGAVTSLMYGAEDPSIAGMVLDSPFFDLVELMMELVDTYKFRLPRFTIRFAIQHMRRAIQKKAKFDIMDLNTIKVARSCFVPVLLGHAIDDDFIQPHHSDRIYEAYMGDKNIIKFEGDHNSPRPQFYFDSINIFFHNVLRPPDDVSGDFSDNIHDYFGKIDVLGGTQTNSTEDAIAQLRSIRTLSRTEVPSASPLKDAPAEAKGEEVGRDVFSSSSKMINFELSNVNPCDPCVLGSMGDDNYVEYTFEEVANFPCSEEEEQRMLMEAVAESLRELEMKEPNVGEHILHLPSCEDTHCTSLRLSNPCLEVQSSAHDSISEMENLDETISGHSSEDASTPKVSSSSGGASNSSNAALNDAEVDVSGCTRATLTVERSPKSHAKEGLLRRLDLGFFKSK